MTFELHWSQEAAEAKSTGRPLVALESTIITHGMPFPQNAEVARQVEADIRAEGAVPATMAVLEGTLHVGLEDTELEALAQAQNVLKLSRADFAAALAQGATGATTVAATMIAARLAGIEVFATGGIGGVHRGAETSFDISADLQELSKTHVTVVAAGAKAILDVPKTLEVLETLGVPVITYGQDSFPAFWSSMSDHQSPLRMDSDAQIARAHVLRHAIGLLGGQLVANPVPKTEEIAQDVIRPWIETALAEANAKQILAKDVTPYLLQRIYELSDGQSLTTNIALVRNNARLAARIAQEISKLRSYS